MLRRLIDGALEKRLAVLAGVALFALTGWLAFRELTIEAFPDVTDPQVQVITLYAGHAAEEVERQVTLPIEKEMNGLPRLFRMRSTSLFGLSVVTLTFKEDMADVLARQQVAERLMNVEVPPGVSPSLAPLYTPIGEIYRYTLVSPSRTPMELREVQDWVMERQLRQVDGVADVVSFGGFQKQFEVKVDPTKLKAYDVTLHQVVDAIANANANAGGNYVNRGAEELVVRGLGFLRGEEDLADVVLTARAGTPLRVGDVAQVKVGPVLRRGAVGKDAETDVVEGIVLLRKGENPSAVLASLREKVDGLNARILPKDVKVVPYYDRTELVGKTLHTVSRNLVEGAILVLLVLFMFLMDLRGALVVASVIPLALLAAFVFLRGRGLSANLLSLGAVDFGIIVDGAVVVVENVFRRLSHAPAATPRERLSRVAEATGEVASPMFFSVLIIILAYLPIFTLQRVEGRIFAPMANTVAAALVGSLILSLTLVPVLAYYAFRKGVAERESPLVRLIKRGYAPSLDAALRHGRTVLVAALIAVVAGLALVSRLGSEFLPELDEGTLWVTATLPQSISMERAAETVPRIRASLCSFPEVRGVVSQLGRPEDGTDPKLMNNAEFFVDLRPEAEWTPGRTREGLVKEMEDRLREIPGVEYNFSQPIKDNVEESISGLKGQIAVKLFGEDLHVLADKGEEIRRAIASVPGAADLQLLQAGELPQLQIEVDRKSAARYGVNVADVEEAIEVAVGGKRVTELWEGERHHGVVVRFAEAYRNGIPALRDLPVATQGGVRVPLSELARIHVATGRAAINREANQRYVGLKCNVRGRDLGGFVAEAQAAVARVGLPDGYYLTWGGEFENQRRAMARLAVIIPLSILVIFLVLWRAFRSGRTATLLVLNVPFAAIGGVLALWITGIHLSVSAAIGFIALFGVAVMNGTMMVTCIRRLREGGTPLDEAVREGALTRLRPVLMTATVASLGFVPMAMAHGIGSETQKPLATVVIGGLVSATLLTLWVLPVIYRRLGEGKAERAPAAAADPGQASAGRATG